MNDHNPFEDIPFGLISGTGIDETGETFSHGLIFSFSGGSLMIGVRYNFKGDCVSIMVQDDEHFEEEYL